MLINNLIVRSRFLLLCLLPAYSSRFSNSEFIKFYFGPEKCYTFRKGHLTHNTMVFTSFEKIDRCHLIQLDIVTYYLSRKPDSQFFQNLLFLFIHYKSMVLFSNIRAEVLTRIGHLVATGTAGL
jgi:hypothetical protein